MRIILIMFFLLSLAGMAQEKQKKDTMKFKADLSLTGFWQGGNVETLIFRAASGVQFDIAKDITFRTQNSYVLQEFGGDKADEDVLSLNFLNINSHKRLHPVVLGFFSTNFRRQINYRYLVGGGFSYQVFKKDKNQINMSFTTEYEHTEFNTTDFKVDAYDGQSDIDTWRSTLWIKGIYHLFKNKMILTHESFFQPSLEESNNFRWRADIGLEFPIWKFLNFKINYYRTYESIVVESQLQEDEFLTFGLTLKSY